jgi:pimeloyl-ACP methyl ester carboxylesterase
MPRALPAFLAAAALTLTAAAQPAPAQPAPASVAPASSEILNLPSGVSLRRLHRPGPRGGDTVLLLHGFPETIRTWDGVAARLAGRAEVHAFDWPGYGGSSRPLPDRFDYSPRGYARLLRDYLRTSQIDRSRLTIYATDIGALPVLLLALEEPDIAKRIIVGDFAPLNRPQFMAERLQKLKDPATAESARLQYNKARDEIVENAFKRGVPPAAQVQVSPEFRDDMLRGWSQGPISSADAFAAYYLNFTRDEDHLEANLASLKSPIEIVWGEIDPFIDKKMGEELAERTGFKLTILPGTGHYPHLQDPESVAWEILAGTGRPGR